MFAFAWKAEESMGCEVARRCQIAGRHGAPHSKRRSSRNAERVQDSTACRTRSRTATRRSQLTNLPTEANCHVPRARNEVAEGCFNAVQALDRPCRSVENQGAPASRVWRFVHERHLCATHSGHDRE